MSEVCTPIVCGDGRKDPLEACEDGNLMSHDGCSSTCQVEMPSWQRLGVAPGTCNAFGNTMTTEVASGRVILNRADCDVVSLDDDHWTSLGKPAPTPARTGYAVAYDRSHANTVLFGGQTTPSTALQDTWLFDSAWHQVTPAAQPPANAAHAMAWSGAVVVLAVVSSDVFHTDTWTWDGATWTQRTPATVPTAITHAAMAYDPVHGYALLSGGQNAFATATSITMTWDGTDWQVLSPSRLARFRHVMIADAARGRMLIIGGLNNQVPKLTTVEEWDGNAWSDVPGDTPFTQTSNLAGAYDPIGRRSVIVVGETGETWQFRWEYPGEVDESCIVGDDVDGDGLKGCDDPDCSGMKGCP